MANIQKRGEIQRCKICGNIIEVLRADGGPLVCCGEPMELLAEKGLESEGKENSAAAKAMADKHVPVIEKTENSVKIKIGLVPHPMEAGHYIEWIEIWPEGEEKSCRKYLKPGDAPEAEFGTKAEKITARAYCNIHGLWKAEI